MDIISFGGGVQTTTIIIMCCLGELPIPDHVIFADTQWETQSTYDYIDWLDTTWMQPHGITLQRITKGDIRAESIAPDSTFASMPFKTLKPDDTKGLLRRQCTNEYKIQPIYKAVRTLLGLEPYQRYTGIPIKMWMGISWDESVRMKPNRVSWIENTYPLIDRRMTRHQCLAYLHDHDIPTPPKSACIGCPFHGNLYWRDLKRHSPLEFQDAVTFEREVNTTPVAKKGQVFLHQSCLPLDQVNFGEDQDDLFGEECEGHCGV